MPQGKLSTYNLDPILSIIKPPARPESIKSRHKMGTQQMEQHGHGNVYGTIFTIIMVFIAKFTLSDLAAIAAVFAGFTTGGLNLWRWNRERKNKNNANIKP